MKCIPLALVLMAVATQAQQSQTPTNGKWNGYSYRPDRCLVVSANNNRFAFRDSWAYETKAKTFKSSELAKFEQCGIHVIRLPQDATDSDVKVAITKCQQAHLDPISAAPVTSTEPPGYVPISQ